MSSTSADELQMPSKLNIVRAELGKELPGHVSHDNLVKFLRWKPGVARAIERARSLLEWQKTPEGACLSSNLRLSEDEMLQKIVQSGVLMCPEGLRDKVGRQLVVVRLFLNDFADGRTAEDLARTFMYMIEYAIQDASVQRNGLGILLAFEHAGPSNFGMEVPKLIATEFSGHYPVKVKAIYMLNASFFFSHMIFPVVSLLLPEKLRQRIVFITDADIPNYIEDVPMIEQLLKDSAEFDAISDEFYEARWRHLCPIQWAKDRVNE